MRNRNYLMAGGFVFLTWLFGCFVQQQSSLKFLGGLGDRAEQMLAYRDVPLNWEGPLLCIDSQHQREVVDVLCQVLHINDVALAVHQHNLANYQTTLTANGEPYRRQYLEFREDGSILGIKQDMSDFNWVFNPRHPDSVKEGPKEGYVAKPNLSEVGEKYCLNALEREQQALRKVLNQIAPDVIVFDRAPDLDDIAKLESPLLHSPKPTLDEASALLFQRFVEMDSQVSYVGQDFSHQWLVSQSDFAESGQASVATALNWIHQDKDFNAKVIDEKYGFRLLDALNEESSKYGLQWRDAGDLTSSHWPLIAETVNQNKLPVILAFRGEPSPTDLGYIVTIVKVDGERVTYTDSYEGVLKTTTKEALLKADRHPDGNFVFVPQ